MVGADRRERNGQLLDHIIQGEGMQGIRASQPGRAKEEVMPRKAKWIPPIEKEELYNMRIIEIAVRCQVVWSNPPYETILHRRATEKNLYAAHEALLAFYDLAKYILASKDEDALGVKLGSVIKFNEAMDHILIARHGKAPSPNLRAALTSALEKGLDPAALREILFWDLAEFRAAILNALHAKGESIIRG